MDENPKRTAYAHIEGKDGCTTTITYDVTKAPNESLVDVVSIAINAHEAAHGSEEFPVVRITAEFEEESA